MDCSRFSQATGAEAYVAGIYEHTEENYDAVEALPVDELTFGADQVVAMTFEYERDGQTYTITNLMVQSGRLVFDLSLEGFAQADLVLLDQIMTDTLECADGGCNTTIEAPAELLDYQDEQAATFADW